MPSSTPTPTPILIEIVESSGSIPWWGVPVIAGVFLLTGGLLTFLFTRSNDDRKADRERADAWNADLLDRGAQLLDAADTIRSLGLLSLNRTSSQFAKVVSSKGMSAAEEIVLRSRRVALVMPPEWEADLQDLVAWTTMLITPPFQSEGQLLALQKQLEAMRAVESRLRRLRSLKPLERVDADHSWLPEMAKKSMVSLQEEVARESAAPAEPSQSSGFSSERATEPDPTS